MKLEIESISVVVRCSDGNQRAVQFGGREAKCALGYLRQLQGTIRLGAEPMILLRKETILELTRLATKPPTLRDLAQSYVQAWKGRCDAIAKRCRSIAKAFCARFKKSDDGNATEVLA